MAKKCVACRRRNSISVEERGIAPLCGPCWDRQGDPVKVGDRVICTSGHPSCDGVVRKIKSRWKTVDGQPRSEVIIETEDGTPAEICSVELVVVR